MGFLGFGKKETKNEETTVLNQLDSTRTMGKKIVEILSGINFERLAADPKIAEITIPDFKDGQEIERNGKDIVNDLRGKSEYLVRKISNESTAELVKIESERIDGQILFFAEELSSSLSTGKLNTANMCMLGLGYGIEQGHKSLPISVTEPEKIRKEIELRLDKINIYKNIVKLSTQIDQHRNQISKYNELYSQSKCQFEAEREQLKEEKNGKEKQIYSEIANLTGDQCLKLSERHFNAWHRTNSVNNLFNQTDQIAMQISALKNAVSINEKRISGLKNSAIAREYEIDTELDTEIREQLSQISRTMADMNNDIIEHQGQLDELKAEFDAAVNSKAIKMAIFKSAREAEKMEKIVEKRENDEKEGMKNLSEFYKSEAEKALKELEEQKIAEQQVNENRNILRNKKQTVSFD